MPDNHKNLIDQLILKATLDASDDQLFANVGKPGFPSQDNISSTQSLIKKKLDELKKSQKASSSNDLIEKLKYKLLKADNNLKEKIIDIINAIEKNSLAFQYRNLDNKLSDEFVKQIWDQMIEDGHIKKNK